VTTRSASSAITSWQSIRRRCSPRPGTARRSRRHAAADGVRVSEEDCQADLARRTTTGAANRLDLAALGASRARARGTRGRPDDAAAPGAGTHRDGLADAPRWAVPPARGIGARLTGRRRGAATRPQDGVHEYAGFTSTARPEAEGAVELAGYGGRGGGRRETRSAVPRARRTVLGGSAQAVPTHTAAGR